MFLMVTPGWTVQKQIGPYGPFRFDRRFAFSNFASWGSGRNRGFVSCVEASRGANCVFDIGAHIGLVTLPVSTVVGDGGAVFSFEPADANRRYLERHLRANGTLNVEVVPFLLGENCAEAVEFYEHSEDSGMNSLAAATGASRGYAMRYKRQTTVDAFCAERGIAPDVIKIDAEGAEFGILKGSVETLRRARPILYLSTHPGQLEALGSSVGELVQLLDTLNYRITDMDGVLVPEPGPSEYLAVPTDC